MTSPPVMIVADDLTGANAAAVLYTRRGLRTRTVIAGSKDVGSERFVDVSVVATGSRQLPPEEASERLRTVLSAVKAAEAQLLVKRIDTTLRGPIGAELTVMLAHRRSGRGGRAAALAVPAYPAAHRTTLAGVHLVGGIPLARSSVAAAWPTQVRTSRVSELLVAGTTLTTKELHFDVLDSEDQVLENALADALRSADVTIADALNDADLERLAGVASRVRTYVGDIMVVDSGPFSAFYCEALKLTPQIVKSPILVVVGSPAEITQIQLKGLKQSISTVIRSVDEHMSPGELAALAAGAIDGGATVAGWHVPPQGGYTDQAWVSTIPTLLATATRQLLTMRLVRGVFACGGEVAAAVLEALDAHGLEVKTEIQPLVVAGRIVGGTWSGLPTVTKGGLVGDENAVSASISYLETFVNEPETMEVVSR